MSLTAIKCKGESCGQILAYTDGRVLIFGTAMPAQEDDAAAHITHPVTLTCPRIGCRRTRGWQPAPNGVHLRAGQNGSGRVKSP